MYSIELARITIIGFQLNYSDLMFEKKLDQPYNYCTYTNHPHTILLVGEETVDLLDARVDRSPHSLFSINNEQLRTFYNIHEDEVVI